ncbi:hypothetical protein CQ018_03260 [Arthrobacter sp. MYb227]|uniref:type II secretion system F family protein n=1 Tax=Arthrobacter sp. MYb227 TaxID=1848601 RepID=UPI000CFD0BF8|nr:type II secretion system F family protein [Arthrobacter sp. MYb227]PQZ96301.1 hypothetical protein CQ018_03260 [Arthrobacter sp. MYb227]
MVMIIFAVFLGGLFIWVLMHPTNPPRTPAQGFLTGRFGRIFQRSTKDIASETEDYAKVIRQLSSLLSAGSSNTTSFEILEKVWDQAPGQVGKDIHTACLRTLTQVRTGGTIQEGLIAHAAHNKLAAKLWNRLAWCFAISERSGAALAQLLDHLATDLESSADMRRALDAALAGPRATSKLLTILPMIGLGLGQLLGIEPFTVLLTHPLGRIAMISGIVLWATNRWWCKNMLSKIMRLASA